MVGKRTGLWISLVALVALLVACSAAPAPKSEPGRTEGGKDLARQAAPGAVAPSAPAALAPQGQLAEGARASSGQTSDSAKPSATTAGQAASIVPWDRMIIRTATLSLSVKDVEASLAAVRDLATGVGGFVAQSSSRYDGEYQIATVTIQVPAERFDSVVDSIRKIAVKVESENGNSQDVTEEFTDLEAQVRNLQATEARLLALLEKATRMEDILTLQRELTNVRGEIERRQGRVRFLTRRSEMSTVTVSLRPEGIAKPPKPEPVWRPLETARKAWEASSQVLLAIADVVITIVVFFWWLIPLVLLAIYVLRGRVWQRRPGTAG